MDFLKLRIKKVSDDLSGAVNVSAQTNKKICFSVFYHNFVEIVNIFLTLYKFKKIIDNIFKGVILLYKSQ